MPSIAVSGVNDPCPGMDGIILFPIVEKVIEEPIDEIRARTGDGFHSPCQADYGHVLFNALIRFCFHDVPEEVGVVGVYLSRGFVIHRHDAHVMSRRKFAIGSDRITSAQDTPIQTPALDTFYRFAIGVIIRFEILLGNPVVFKNDMASVGDGAAWPSHADALALRVCPGHNGGVAGHH